MQDKRSAEQCLEVHMQQLIRMHHVLLEVLFSWILPSEIKEKLGEKIIEALKYAVPKP